MKGDIFITSLDTYVVVVMLQQLNFQQSELNCIRIELCMRRIWSTRVRQNVRKLETA